LQQDIAASLQQPFMSQQASAAWLEFCGGLRVRPAAEMANKPAQAKLIKSTLIFLIIVAPKIIGIAGAIRKNTVMAVSILPPGHGAGRLLDQKDTKPQMSLRLIRQVHCVGSGRRH